MFRIIPQKMEGNKEITIDEQYDKITKQQNVELYDFFVEKLQNFPYATFLLLKRATKTLVAGRHMFLSMATQEQVSTLLNVLDLFTTGRTTGCDLRNVGGVEHAAAVPMAAKFSGYKGKYKAVRIVNVSASGLFQSESKNLLEYL